MTGFHAYFCHHSSSNPYLTLHVFCTQMHIFSAPVAVQNLSYVFTYCNYDIGRWLRTLRRSRKIKWALVSPSASIQLPEKWLHCSKHCFAIPFSSLNLSYLFTYSAYDIGRCLRTLRCSRWIEWALADPLPQFSGEKSDSLFVRPSAWQ